MLHRSRCEAFILEAYVELQQRASTQLDSARLWSERKTHLISLTHELAPSSLSMQGMGYGDLAITTDSP